MSDVIEREWIVEQYYDGVMRVIGKVIPKKKTLFFNNEDLENIWDLANWGCSKPIQFIPNDELYRCCKCFMNDTSLGYVDMGKTNVCNDDIFIRRHYDLNNGFWIKSNRRANVDEWVYGTREEFLNNMKNRF